MIRGISRSAAAPTPPRSTAIASHPAGPLGFDLIPSAQRLLLSVKANEASPSFAFEISPSLTGTVLLPQNCEFPARLRDQS